MARRKRYDIHAEWDDPFERKTDRRLSRRWKSNFTFSVTVDDGRAKRRMVGPAVLLNASMGGGLALTKHDLRKGQRVLSSFPTDFCPESMGMPREFQGHAEVMRVEAVDERKRLVGLRFGPAFTENMEFGVFMEYVQSISSVMASS